MCLPNQTSGPAVGEIQARKVGVGAHRLLLQALLVVVRKAAPADSFEDDYAVAENLRLWITRMEVEGGRAEENCEQVGRKA